MTENERLNAKAEHWYHVADDLARQILKLTEFQGLAEERAKQLSEAAMLASKSAPPEET